MSTKKPLEQIIEDKTALMCLKMAGDFNQYTENTRTKLNHLIKMVFGQYRFGGDANYELVRRLDRVIQGWETTEELIEFIKNREDKQD
ncbi:hypothetical protein HP548_05520 [Paenibacillus taichungensis]|uniref:Uncharacterized protein n=1 Tax=Paenibacillus taichungensis TaxID=484184 RepID=A0ABX2MFR4_9BACL|nr:hypothetical protein [Paenibacillus taichungensis]NUU53535.1 hypothetical protein [Paenibacillus taichungensis]